MNEMGGQLLVGGKDRITDLVPYVLDLQWFETEGFGPLFPLRSGDAALRL